MRTCRGREQFAQGVRIGVLQRQHLQDQTVAGDAAQEIVEYAKTHHCEGIVMGTRGLGSVATLVLGSVAHKVLHLTHVPITLVK